MTAPPALTPALAPLFITTAIDYVNAAPHLGHAYEKMATDALVRYYRLKGHPVFFLTGTDEHGIKIEKNAKAKGIGPQTFVDELVPHFQSTWALCDVAYDRFLRTTESAHYAVVAHIWQALVAAGDLYKAPYQGLYCSGCEAFLTEKDLDHEGHCLIHQVAPEAVVEENWFFKLSRYKEALLAQLDVQPDWIFPAFRQQEVRKLLEEVEDISVSRSTRSVTWGIPVPNDPSQVIYVWIDALSNYLTGLGYTSASDEPFTTFWANATTQAPQAIHVIGKDILRFHAVYWAAMLLALKLPLPKRIVAHGFITLNEAKISKSLGNVLSAKDVLSHFELPTADALRYYLLSQTPFGQDGNFTLDDFKAKVNADLANNLGNLLNRTLSMLAKYANGVVPTVNEAGDQPAYQALRDPSTWQMALQEAYEGLAFHKAAELCLSRVDVANRLINDEAPWTLFKEAQHERLAALLYTVLETLRQVAIGLSPLLPHMAPALLAQLGLPADLLQQKTTLATLLAKSLPPGLATAPAGPLLPRLESELAGDAKKAASAV